jgi:uncharacterized protein
MLSFIADKRQALTELCDRYHIKTMYLFGSATTAHFNDACDIDFLISFKEIPFELYTDNCFNLQEKLEKLFNRKIDIITQRSLSNPYFIRSIEETKQLLYAA